MGVASSVVPEVNRRSDENRHCEAEARPDDRVRRKVDFLIRTVSHSWDGIERRHDRRVPFPYPIRLTPSDHVGIPTGEPTRVVLGRHLAERGLDFYHKEPMPHRHVIASFECGDGRWISLLLQLHRCRFNSTGWYDTGGRFLKPVDSPGTDELEAAKWEAAEPHSRATGS